LTQARTPASRRRKWGILACVLVLLAGAAAGAHQVRAIVRERRLERALAEGVAAYERSDYVSAMRNLGRYVGRNRTDAEAIRLLAESRRRVPEANGKHLVSTLALARAAHEADRTDPRALELMLEMAEELAFLTELRDAADSILALNPAHERALRARTLALAATGRSEEALASAREAVARLPDSTDMHEALIHLLIATGGDAGGYAQSIADRHPDRLAFALLRVRTLVQLKNVGAALEACRKAAAIRPTTRAEMADLLRCTRVLDLKPEFKELLAWAEASPAFAAEAGLASAELAWKEGRPHAPLAPLAEALAEVPDAELGLRSVLMPGERALVRAELARRPSSQAVYWSQVAAGLDALQGDDFAAAEAALKSAAAGHPALGYAQYFLGQVYARTGAWRSAAESLIAASRTDPAWRAAASQAALLLMDHGDLARAREQAMASYAATRQLSEALLLVRACVLLVEAGEGEPELPVQLLGRVDEIEAGVPGLAALEAFRARTLLAVGRTADAAVSARRLVASPPGALAASLDSIARLAVLLRPHDGALAAELEALLGRVAPDPRSADVAMAKQLAATGRAAEAERMIAELIRTAPAKDLAGLRVLRAAVLDRDGAPAALEAYTELAAEHPQDRAAVMAILGSRAAWTDRALVQRALGAAASLLGAESVMCRLYEARKLITFAPSADSARRVVTTVGEIVRADPANTLAACLLADAYTLLENRDAAIECLARAANAAPRDAAAGLQLVSMLQQAGRASEAAPRLAALSLLRGMPTEQLRRRARLLTEQGMREQASADVAELAARGDPIDRLALAAERAEAGDARAAREIYAELLEDVPGDDRILISAARFTAAADGAAAGLDLLARGSSDQVIVARAELLERSGDVEASEQLLRSRAAKAVAGGWLDLARFYTRQKRTADAMQAIEEGLKLAPADPDLVLLRGLAQPPPGAIDSGRADVVASLATASTTPDGRLVAEALRAFGESGDRETLITSLAQATRKHPRSYAAWHQLATAHAEAGNIDAAVQAANACLAANPADHRAARLGAESLGAAGRFQQAHAAVVLWRQLAPTDGLAADAFAAGLHLAEARFEDAARVLRPRAEQIMAAASPEHADVLATALAATGDHAGAMAALRRAHPDGWQAALCRVAQSITPRPRECRAWLALLDLSGDTEPAVRLTAAHAWYKLAAASSDPADMRRAISEALPVAEVPALRGPGGALLGAAYSALGENETAIGHYRIAAAEMPQNPAILNNFAYLLASSRPGSTEAVDLARRAVAAATEQGISPMARRSLLETLGYAQVRAGQHAEAEQTFESGLKIDGAAVDLLIGKLEAQVALGKMEEARAGVAQLDARVRATLSPQLAARLAAVRVSLGGEK
jgi:predicted Zn-dependent protease